MVSAISRRAAAAAGSRFRLAPSSAERGSMPAPESSNWFTATAPSAHGHDPGTASMLTAAAP